MSLFAEMPNAELLEKVLSPLQRYLSYRERSCHEVHLWLKKKALCSTEENQLILNFIATEGWVNDERFTIGRIGWRLQNGRGPFFIQQELRHLGISNDLIQSRLGSVSFDEFVAAGLEKASQKLAQLEARYEDATEIKQRLIRYLHGRGFSYDHSQAIYTELGQGD